MARPIKATPVLSQKDYGELLERLKENETKKITVSIKTIDSKTREKIINEGPKW